VLRGPFNEDAFALLAATLRQIDERHGGVDIFELAALAPTETALEAVETMMKRAVPDHPDRITEFTTFLRHSILL
jgi:hypothetical protein